MLQRAAPWTQGSLFHVIHHTSHTSPHTFFMLSTSIHVSLLLQPSHRGKWSSASKEEVEAEMAKGTPYCYRFRVPANKEVRG